MVVFLFFSFLFLILNLEKKFPITEKNNQMHTRKKQKIQKIPNFGVKKPQNSSKKITAFMSYLIKT
jgi:hypothetical protein